MSLRYLKKFPTGKFRAFVSGCYADEVHDGEVVICFELTLIEHWTKDVYTLCYPIANNKYDPHSRAFFDSVGFDTLQWGQYYDLAGLTFDCEIICEQQEGYTVPVLDKIQLLCANIPETK